MAIVVDVNCFPSVFDPQNELHADFAPVKAWIEKRDGFLIYGGKTFKDELVRSHRRARLVRLMRDAGQAVEIAEAVVNAIEVQVRAKVEGSSCNDPHVIALLAAARCSLLCSQDKESFPHIKDRSLYPKGCPRVKIYTGPRNVALLKPTKRSSIANAV